jgi:hypothetical protein
MVDVGELTPWQRDAALPLDAILKRWSGQSHADFWKREALWCDPRVTQPDRIVVSCHPRISLKGAENRGA